MNYGKRFSLSSSLKQPIFSPEFRIMLAGLQQHLSKAPEPNWQFLLNGKIDWHQVLQFCQHHQVTPFVYESLKQQRDLIPQEALTNLKQQVRLDKINSAHLAQFLNKILSLFQKENIEVFPYKGLTLSDQLFSDMAIRPTNDLDIAIRASDYMKVKQILLTNGVNGPFTSFAKLASPQQETLFIKNNHHLRFHYQDSIKLELHLEIMPPDRLQTFKLNALWTLLEDDVFFDYPIKVMPKKHLLFVPSMISIKEFSL